MKSTNLYSGLAIILAAAANTAVVGCAGIGSTEDTIDAESSVQSVSSACEDEQGTSEGAPEQGSDQGAPCNSGREHQGNYSGSSGSCNGSQGGYSSNEGNCGGPAEDEQGGYDEDIGGDVPVGGAVGVPVVAAVPVPTYPVPVYYPVLVSPFACGFGCGWGGFGFGGFGRGWW